MRVRLQQCEAIVGTMRTPKQCKRREKQLRKHPRWGKFFCKTHFTLAAKDGE